MSESRSPAQASERLVELVYELLDAHNDTAQLARELEATGLFVRPAASPPADRVSPSTSSARIQMRP